MNDSPFECVCCKHDDRWPGLSAGVGPELLGFMEYVDATKAETNPEQFQRIMRRLQATPVLRWLIENARLRGRFDHS